MSSFGYKPSERPVVYMTERAFETAQQVYGIGDIIPDLADIRDIDRHVFPAQSTFMGEGDFWPQGPLLVPPSVTLLVRDASGKHPELCFARQPNDITYIPAENLIGNATRELITGRQNFSRRHSDIINVPVRDFSQPSYAIYLAYGMLECTREANPRIVEWAGRVLGTRGKALATFALGETKTDKLARAQDIGEKYPNALQPWVPRHDTSYVR